MPIDHRAHLDSLGKAYAKIHAAPHVKPVEFDYARMSHRVLGRIAVVMAILVFLLSYLFGIDRFGLLMGIGLGWAPAALLAWLTAVLVTKAGAAILHQDRDAHGSIH